MLKCASKDKVVKIGASRVSWRGVKALVDAPEFVPVFLIQNADLEFGYWFDMSE